VKRSPRGRDILCKKNLFVEVIYVVDISGTDIPSEERPLVKRSRAGEVGRILCKRFRCKKSLPVKKTGEEVRSVKKLICKKNKFVKNILWDRACLV
jgi:hypothetical protein